jgi:hypothetical protein
MDYTRRMDRREAIKWIMAAGATVSMLDARSIEGSPSKSGYGTDPNLMEVYKPGDLWPLTFSKEQHRTVTVLCDLILPADGKSPSASELKVPDFIDEWISAPYPRQRADRELILQGLTWLDRQSSKRFQKQFADLSEPQKHLVCDEICSIQEAAPALVQASRFFAKVRVLAMGGFYTTAQGMRDIQYLGNVPLTKFDGPPPEVLSYLKLA